MADSKVTLIVELDGDTDAQAWAMAEHVKAVFATMLGDEQEKGNIEVTNFSYGIARRGVSK